MSERSTLIEIYVSINSMPTLKYFKLSSRMFNCIKCNFVIESHQVHPLRHLIYSRFLFITTMCHVTSILVLRMSDDFENHFAIFHVNSPEMKNAIDNKRYMNFMNAHPLKLHCWAQASPLKGSFDVVKTSLVRRIGDGI